MNYKHQITSTLEYLILNENLWSKIWKSHATVPTCQNKSSETKIIHNLMFLTWLHDEGQIDI